MRIPAKHEKEHGHREALCPRCGADAEWSLLERDPATVEVVCPDCGRFEVPRAEFDFAEADMAGPGDRE
jgi:hypothetical protein